MYKKLLLLISIGLFLQDSFTKETPPKKEKDIFQASQDDNLDIIKKLLDEGVDINAKDHNGYTALMFAADNNRVKAVELLLEKGADPDNKNLQGQTAADLAKTQEIKNLLLEASQKQTPTQPDEPEEKERALFDAIKTENINEIKKQLGKDVDLNMKDTVGNPLLLQATALNNSEIVNLLLQQNIDPNQKNPNNGISALEFASIYGYIDIVKTLLEKNANPAIVDNSNQTPLMKAAENNNKDIVKILVQHLIKKDKKENINAQDQDGYTALMLAAMHGHKKVVEYLVEQNADINKQNSDDNTAADLAIEYPKIQTILEEASKKQTPSQSNKATELETQLKQLTQKLNALSRALK